MGHEHRVRRFTWDLMECFYLNKYDLGGRLVIEYQEEKKIIVTWHDYYLETTGCRNSEYRYKWTAPPTDQNAVRTDLLSTVLSSISLTFLSRVLPLRFWRTYALDLFRLFFLGHAFIYAANLCYDVIFCHRATPVLSCDIVRGHILQPSVAKDNNLPDAYQPALWSEIIGFAIPQSNATAVNPKQAPDLAYLGKACVRELLSFVAGLAGAKRRGGNQRGCCPCYRVTGDDLSQHCWNHDWPLSRSYWVRISERLAT